MPGRDGSGPEGRGPMTGWGNGNCAIKVGDNAKDAEMSSNFRGRPGQRRFTMQNWGPGRFRGNYSNRPANWGCGRRFRGNQFR